jgi:hypothetical protein
MLDKYNRFGVLVHVFVKLGVLVTAPQRRVSVDADYTTFSIEVGAGVFYANFYFERVRCGHFGSPACITCNIYYGLGPYGGERSAIKRFKHVSIWKAKRAAL